MGCAGCAVSGRWVRCLHMKIGYPENHVLQECQASSGKVRVVTS